MSRISDMLGELMAVTRPPRGMDAAQVSALTLRYMRIMREFHDDVCVKALDDWPRSHHFFPTEPEFRDALDMAHRILRPSQPAPPYDDGMSAHPVGNTKAFIDEFRAGWPSKCEAYFDGVSRYSEHRIGTEIKFIPDMVERVAPGLLAKHGVRVVEPRCYHVNDDKSISIEWRWS